MKSVGNMDSDESIATKEYVDSKMGTLAEKDYVDRVLKELSIKIKDLRNTRLSANLRLDKTRVPYVIWLPNGAGIQSAYDDNAIVASNYLNELTKIWKKSAAPTDYDVLPLTSPYYIDKLTVINTVNDEIDYEWSNVKIKDFTGAKNLARILYCSGVWTGQQVESIGAKQK